MRGDEEYQIQTHPTDNRSDNDDDKDEPVRNANANVPVLVRHQLGDGAHGHLAKTGTEPRDCEPGDELGRAMRRSRNDKADATDGIAGYEKRTATKQIRVPVVRGTSASG